MQFHSFSLDYLFTFYNWQWRDNCDQDTLHEFDYRMYVTNNTLLSVIEVSLDYITLESARILASQCYQFKYVTHFYLKLFQYFWHKIQKTDTDLTLG